jgi:ATP-binding cassette subfamily C protein CydD
MWPRKFLRINRVAERSLLLSIGSAATAAAIFALTTVLLAWVIASAFIDHQDLAQLRGPLLAIGALIIARAGLLVLREPFAQRASNRYRSALRPPLMSTLTQHASRADHAPSAVSATIIGSSVDALDEYITQFLPALALAGIVPVTVFAIIAILDPWTTIVLALAGPLLIALLAVIGRRTRDLAAARFEELSWLGALYADLLSGLATLKTFGRESDALETIEETSAQFGRSSMAVLRTAFQTSLVIEWAATASTALVAVEVSFRLVDHQLSFSTALAVLMLTPEFFTPLRSLASAYHAGQTGNAALAAIDEVLGPEPWVGSEREDRSVTGASSSRTPLIQFDAVSFRYSGRHEGALDGLSFIIAAGETVALEAPSGSGKTTAAALLLGFESPDAGAILIDDAPLTELDMTQWRSRVAWVPQDPTIFAGTIADNIGLGLRNAESGAIIEAARVAAIHETIAALPDGYDTRVGEGGLRLSGGQRQRIALARALLRDAPVMILDEFTAQLDPMTEQSILAKIEPILRDRTVLLITHRPSVLRLANRIVTLRPTDSELR